MYLLFSTLLRRLTAFVLRVYAQAKRYIFIDDKDIEDSRKWLLSLQDSNSGCFKDMGMIHHKEMKVGMNFKSSRKGLYSEKAILKIREILSKTLGSEFSLNNVVRLTSPNMFN